MAERLLAVALPTDRTRAGVESSGEVVKLLARIHSDVGLVNGYKLERNDPAHRILIGFLYNKFARFLFRIRIRDIDCDFRLIRRLLLEEIELSPSSGTICVELVRSWNSCRGELRKSG